MRVITILQGISVILVFFISLKMIGIGEYALFFGVMGLDVTILMVTEIVPDDERESA